MNFDWARAQLVKHVPVRRAIWKDNTMLVVNIFNVLVLMTLEGTYADTMRWEDICAEDWELAFSSATPPIQEKTNLLEMVRRDQPIEIIKGLRGLADSTEAGMNGDIRKIIVLMERMQGTNRLELLHLVLGECSLDHATLMCERGKFKFMNGGQ